MQWCCFERMESAMDALPDADFTDVEYAARAEGSPSPVAR